MGKKRLIFTIFTELKKELEIKKENHVFSESDYKSYKAGWNDGVQFVVDYINNKFLLKEEDSWNPSVLPSGRTIRDGEFLIDSQPAAEKRNI
tara:strand:- start:23 stop:298 length:276 start_codon:yes stop_codon:yes gene_type:complete